MELFDRKLIYFLEIARTRSLQKASQSLHLTQPALSTSIKKLEEDLGFQLFERERYGLKLTTEGARFHEWLAEQSASIKGSYREKYLAQTNLIRVGVAFTILRHFFQPILKDERFKLHGFQIMSRPFIDMIRAVEEGHLDFAFVGWNGELRSPFLEQERLFDCPCALVGRKGRHDHIRDFDSYAQLEGERWLVETDSTTDRWRTYLRDRPGILLSQHDLFRDYLLRGEGIAEIEVHYFSPAEQSKLVYSLIPSQFQEGSYLLVYRPSISPELLTIAKQMAKQIKSDFEKLWPGLKNGSPKQIRNYIDKHCR